MIKIFLIALFSVLSLSNSFSQTTINFEEFDIPSDSFLNGSEAAGQFESQNIILPNSFDPEFQSWLGWSISSIRDSLTPGFGNQYAAIPAAGFDGSQNYAVSFNFSENGLNILNNDTGIKGLYVTNNTYTYLSLRDGDAFAKKFGGETGDDPDFFLLSILGYQNGEPLPDTLEFYLADYRFEDNDQDYLVSDWTYIDLSQFGTVDSLGFNLSSSDNGQFGMNTPAYFCLDQIILNDSMTTTTNDVYIQNLFDIYPNPVRTQLNLSHDLSGQVAVQVFDLLGHLVLDNRNLSDKRIDVTGLESGTYIIQLIGENSQSSRVFVKE